MKYWYILLGAIVAFFAIIFPRRAGISAVKDKHDEYTKGIVDAEKLGDLRNERIARASEITAKKMDLIENEKQERVDTLAKESQEILTKELSDKFKLKNMDM